MILTWEKQFWTPDTIVLCTWKSLLRDLSKALDWSSSPNVPITANTVLKWNEYQEFQGNWSNSKHGETCTDFRSMQRQILCRNYMNINNVENCTLIVLNKLTLKSLPLHVSKMWKPSIHPTVFPIPRKTSQ